MLDKASPVEDLSALQAWFGGRIPIVLGAVGHRELNGSEDDIARTLRKELRLIGRNYRRSPFVILSGLAEGADRLVARLAMEELDARLIAILPMPAPEFCADFTTPDSREEFSALLERASGICQVPLHCTKDWRENGKARNVQYARVGALIAEQAQILLAIWDNRPSRGLGGTGDVVEWFERGYAPAEYRTYEGDLSLFDPPHPGRCIRIDPITGEREYHNADPKQRRFGLRRRDSIDDILKRTNIYNRDVLRQAAYSVRHGPVAPPAILSRVALHEAADSFEEADALAIFYARRVRLADRVLYALALAAVFAFSAVDIKPLASWGFLAVMGVMATVVSYVLSRSLNTKSLEYRSFAEAMRILFFWRLLGLKHQVWLSYLTKHGSVVRWLRHAVRSIEFVQDSHPKPSAPIPTSERVDMAIEHWVGRQIAYFKTATVTHYRRYRRAIWFTYIAVIMTFAMSTLLAAMSLTYSDNWHAWSQTALVHLPWGPQPIEGFIEQLQLTVGLLAAVGIAAKGFLTRNADEELAKQYTAAREMFEKAERALHRMPPEALEKAAPDILAELGREAMLEQAEWLWLRHSRPFEALN